MMISQPPRGVRPESSDGHDEPPAADDVHPGDVEELGAAISAADLSPEAEKAIRDEMGGPVPDFLRAAQVLRSATDDIKEQVNADPSSGKRGRSRSRRAPVLKQDESARLRRMLADMASLGPAAAQPAEGYRPEVASRARSRVSRVVPPVRQLAYAAQVALSLSNAPMRAIALVGLFGIAGGLGYLAFTVRASVPPAAPTVFEATPAAETVSPAAQRAAASPPAAATQATEPPATSSPAAIATAAPTTTTAVPSPVANAAPPTVRSFAPAPVVLRPSRPAADLSLPAPEPLAVPVDGAVAVTAPTDTGAPYASEPGDTAVVDGSALNVRAAPAKDSRKIGVLSEGDEVAVLDTKDLWTHVRTPDGEEGWVYSSLTETTPRKLIPGADAAPAQEAAPLPAKDAGATATIRKGGVTVRSAAGKGNKALFNLSGGTNVTILGKKDGWVQIKDSRGRTGWAYGTFVSGS